jgi:hypothetical protein
MTNAEGMTNPKFRNSRVARAFVIRSLFRHSSFVIRHSATTLFAATLILLFFGPSASGVELLEEIVEQKYNVDANATLSVENIDGSIRVYAAEQNEIFIEAIKKAYTEERLRGIIVDVKATANNVAITTTFPPRKNALGDRSGTVDYIIVVPQTARISKLNLTNGEILIEGLRAGGSATARLTNGWLAGHNCFAALNLAVETGRLDVAYDWWENASFTVKAVNARGNLHVVLPSDASLNLNATTKEGRIANGFEMKTTKPADLVRSISTVIGARADAAINVETGSGNIRIDKTY